MTGLSRRIPPLLLALAGLLPCRLAAVPHLINYQGRMVVNGVNFDGSGQFKFSLVDRTGAQTYLTSSADSAPAAGIPMRRSRCEA